MRVNIFELFIDTVLYEIDLEKILLTLLAIRSILDLRV